MYEAHFGVPMCGAVLNTLNTRLDAEAIGFMLNHGEAKVLLVDREFSPMVSKALASIERPILVVGVDKLLTQMGKCCKPMPPDAITGFVTRGKGISIHRVECVNYRNMAARNPERVIGAEWGEQAGAIYPVDLVVDAADRQGLLRDISDVLSREKINVTAVKDKEIEKLSYTEGRADHAHFHTQGLSDIQDLKGAEGTSGLEVRFWDSGSGTGSGTSSASSEATGASPASST